MRSLRVVYLVLGPILMLLGALVFWASGNSLVEALNSAKWPAAGGVILSSRTVSNASQRNLSAPEVKYTYMVSGTSYHGSRLEVVTYSSNTSYASDAVSMFPEGEQVLVYYDPAHPDQSVLRPGPNWLAFTLPLVSLLFVVFGAMLVRWAIHVPSRTVAA